MAHHESATTGGSSRDGGGRVERVLLQLASLSLWAMMTVTLVEIVARGVFHASLGIADEIGGYLLVALAFLSLPACHAGRVFHQVEFVLARLAPRQRLAFGVVFDLLCLACAAALVWQCARLVLNSVRSGEVSQNGLDIPLWIPQSLMVLGLAGLAWALVRTGVHGARLLRAGRRAQRDPQSGAEVAP